MKVFEFKHDGYHPLRIVENDGEISVECQNNGGEAWVPFVSIQPRCLKAGIRALLAHNAARARIAEEETTRLRKFAHWCISEFMLDVEGVQDMGVECGLIVPTKVSESCGEDCRCAEYCDFPTTCYRMHESLLPTPPAASGNATTAAQAAEGE